MNLEDTYLFPRTAFYAQQKAAPGYPEPEKVLTLDPKIARTHTTFYDKQNGHSTSVAQRSKYDVGPTHWDPWVK